MHGKLTIATKFIFSKANTWTTFARLKTYEPNPLQENDVKSEARFELHSLYKFFFFFPYVPLRFVSL